MDAIGDNIWNVTVGAISDERMHTYNNQEEAVVEEAVMPKREAQSPVRVSISKEAKEMLTQLEGEQLPASQLEYSSDDMSQDLSEHRRKEHERTAKDNSSSGKKLSENEEDQVKRLKQRDAEVRQHEQAHAASAGPYLRGGPYYQYQTGPDGKMYAIGGHVDVDVGEGGSPEETMRKARTLQNSALSSSDPSSSDQAVAIDVSAMAVKASKELQEEQEAFGYPGV